MSLPDTQELESVIVDIISSARDDGQLSELTVRIVRQKLATHFDLEEDLLNGGDYKSFIKATVHSTLNSLRGASDKNTEVSRREVVGKKGRKKTSNATRARATKLRVKTQVISSDVEPAEVACVPPKRSLTHSKSSEPAKSNKSSEKPESDMKFKSKAIIESSDDEAASEPKAQQSVPPRKEQAFLGSPPKRTQQKVNKSDSGVEMDLVKGPATPGSNFKPRHGIKSLKTGSKGKEPARDPMESELSSVIDEPPKKRQKKQEKSTKLESTKHPEDEKTKPGTKKEALSKDEETINKLKGIVVACGVRKVWKKEFEGLDKSSQQIKRLHSILGDLGMTPRYSLEKAKAIREQRELAQELKDVQEFDKATKSRGKVHRSSSGTESAGQGDSDVDVPTRKKQNARASIMAFLQDQSEEE